MRRRVALSQKSIEAVQVGVVAQLVAEHPADVDLVDGARGDPLAHLAHGADVCRPVE